MKRKRFLTDFEVKAAEADSLNFEGYGSTFGNRDLFGDIIERGAFMNTLPDFVENGKILWVHDMRRPIGKVLDAQEDPHGLFLKFQLSNTSDGKDMAQLIADGAVDKLSIGFDIVRDRFDEVSNTRHIEEVKLYEVSPVPIPANPEAQIMLMKALYDMPDEPVENPDPEPTEEPEIAPIMELMGSVEEVRDTTEAFLDWKAGRVLSTKNLTLVKAAIEALTALLTAAEPDEAEKALTDVIDIVQKARDEVIAGRLVAEGVLV